MMIHGGGFRDGCRTLLNKECMEFAKRGYVVATIDYRLGWVKGDAMKPCRNNFCYSQLCAARTSDGCNPEYKDSMNFAIYRALQDASAAMRFIVHYAGNLNIDTNYLYLDGHSAGAIIATNLCYMNQRDLNLLVPRANSILGPLKQSGNSFRDSYRIAGLFNNWGCLFDTSFISGVQDKIPMIAFHGIDDSIVPFAKGYPLNCTNGAYKYSYGSSLLYKRLISNYPDLPVELYSCYGGHGIFDGDPETDLKILYRIQKAICFFNRVRNGDKTQAYIRIDKQQEDITYSQLNHISPVNCSFKPSYTSIKDNTADNISNSEAPVQFSIAPNPATSQATLFMKGQFKEINITLTDLNGKILWRKENVSERSISLPVKDLANGLYLVNIKNNDYSGVYKLYLQK